MLRTVEPHAFPPGVRALLIHRDQGVGNPVGFSWSPAGAVAPREAALNRAVVAAALRVEPQRIITLRQVHGVQVVRSGIGASGEPPAVLPTADAHWTTDRGLYLGVVVADCCPILLCSAAGDLVAAVHAGWRGAAGNIVEQTVQTLRNAAGVDPSTLLAWIGPCAGGNTYQVGAEVAAQFGRYPAACRSNGAGFLLDLAAVVHQQLLDAGVAAQSIEGGSQPSVCTISDFRYHSFRRDGVLSGRMLAAIGIK